MAFALYWSLNWRPNHCDEDGEEPFLLVVFESKEGDFERGVLDRVVGVMVSWLKALEANFI